jgi:hypothetical protein
MLPCRQGGGSTLPTAVDVHECLLIAFSLGVPAYEMEGITNGELEIQARRRRVDLTIFSLALLSSSASHDSHGLNLHSQRQCVAYRRATYHKLGEMARTATMLTQTGPAGTQQYFLRCVYLCIARGHMRSIRSCFS